MQGPSQFPSQEPLSLRYSDLNGNSVTKDFCADSRFHHESHRLQRLVAVLGRRLAVYGLYLRL